MINRKGQVPSTITWIVAFVIILFFMVLFNLVTLGLAAKKSVSVSEEFFIESEKELRTSYKLGEITANNLLEGFLLSEGRYNDMDVTNYDILFNFRKGDENSLAFITEQSRSFFFEKNKIDSFGLDILLGEEKAGRFGNLVCEKNKFIQVSRDINDKRIVFCIIQNRVLGGNK